MLWTMYIVPTSPFEFGGVWEGGLVVTHTLLGHWDPITENAIQRALAHSIAVNGVPPDTGSTLGLARIPETIRGRSGCADCAKFTVISWYPG